MRGVQTDLSLIFSSTTKRTIIISLCHFLRPAISAPFLSALKPNFLRRKKKEVFSNPPLQLLYLDTNFSRVMNILKTQKSSEVRY